MAAKPKGPTDRKDADVLAELRERYTYATHAWRDIREEGRKNIRYVAGDVWDAKDKKAREDAGRPCLSLDELGQYVNQTINDVRQNKRAIKVTPMGNGATDQTAELQQNLIRQIEYRSNAQQAYTGMFEDAVQRGYGFCRIVAKRAKQPKPGAAPTVDLLNYELLIEPLPNPDLVTVDPDHLKSDAADIGYAFVEKSVSIKDFKRDYPDAKIQNFEAEDVKAQAPGWVNEQRLRLAEYWTIEYQRRQVLLLKGSQQPVYADELESIPADNKIERSEWVDVPYVCQYLTNGLELLAKRGQPKKNAWPGHSIPLVACYGKILWVDDGSGAVRKLVSMIQLARDPAMLYCYYRTAEAEQVGMSTKFPYFVRRGALVPDEASKLQQSLHEPIAFIQVEGQSDSLPAGAVPEMPVRNPFEPAIQALEMGAEGARRAIQAAMGIAPLPTEAQRVNQKSGKALAKIESSAQKGAYHFVDHFDGAITRIGQILTELIPHYYDSARDVTLRKPDDQAQVVRINDPAHPQGVDGKGQPYDPTQGDHDATISVGASFESERDAAEDFADSLAQNPQVFPIIGDLVVKLKNLGPIGDEIADRLTPPQFRQAKQGGPASPADVAQMQGQIQQLQQKLQEAEKPTAVEQVRQQGQVQIKQMDIDFQKSKLERDSETKIAVAELGAKVDRIALFLEERARLGMQAFQADQAAHDRAHDAGMAAMGQQHTADNAAAAAQNASAASDQAHAQALEQQQAAQPPQGAQAA